MTSAGGGVVSRGRHRTKCVALRRKRSETTIRLLARTGGLATAAYGDSTPVMDLDRRTGKRREMKQAGDVHRQLDRSMSSPRKRSPRHPTGSPPSARIAPSATLREDAWPVASPRRACWEAAG